MQGELADKANKTCITPPERNRKEVGTVPDAPFYEEDRLWVERAQQDDRQAFDRLVDKHQSWLLGLCRRLLGDEHLAEDAAVDTFHRAWQHRASFRFGCPFRYWLWRIGRNECL